MFNWLFNKRKSTGLIPQPIDKRDYQYLPISTNLVDKEINLSNLFPEVVNQGEYNSCVGHSVGTLFTYYLKYIKKYTKWDFDFSEAYLWYFGRLRLESQNENKGMILRDAFKVIKEQGFVQKHDWDFKDGYTNFPNTKARLASKFYKLYLPQLPKYCALSDSSDVKNALSNGYPVVFGFPITSKFKSLNSGNQYYDFKDDNKILGYHAMLAVGYDEKGIIVRNSWGKTWGNRGYCTINYDIFNKKAFDLWTLM